MPPKHWEPIKVAQAEPRVIDITPTWSNLVPALVALIENGNAKGRATAIDELYRMAAAADEAVAARAANGEV